MERRLDSKARCPHCGRYVKRGIMRMADHIIGSCPAIKKAVISEPVLDFDELKKAFITAYK